MPALPRFSFSGWNSQSLAPKVNPASVPIQTPGLSTPGGTVAAPTTAPGQLVGTTNAANTNLPQWLADEVARLNAQDALRTAMLGSGGGGGGGGGTAAPAFDPNLGVAAVTNARANYNTSLNQINEQARIQLLIQQRNQLRPTGGFGFNNPLDVPRQLGLDSEIAAYRNVNLPLAAGAVAGRRNVSGWSANPWTGL